MVAMLVNRFTCAAILANFLFWTLVLTITAALLTMTFAAAAVGMWWLIGMILNVIATVVVSPAAIYLVDQIN